MENFRPGVKIFSPLLFWFYMAGKFFGCIKKNGCLKKRYFLTSSYCWTLSALKSLFGNSSLTLQFAKHLIKFSTFCSLSQWNLVLAVTGLLLLVLLLAKSTITCSLVSEVMFIYEKVLICTCKLFSTPGLKFQLGLQKPGWKFQPWTENVIM